MQMSTSHCTVISAIAAFFLSAVLIAAAPARAAETLAPFKDDLFSKQTVLQTGDSGAFEVIDYDEMRDINGRDQIPQKRVQQKYVALGIRKAQAEETLSLDGIKLDVTRVGPAQNAAFTVIFIHGRDGDRRLGANDYSFGGNFNRLKNLVAGNGGVYYSPTVRSFDGNGVAAIAGLIRYASAQSPGRPIILSCASMGSQVCWGIARDGDSVKRLKGMVVMSGVTDPDFTKSAFYKAKLRLWFAHGSRDPVYAAANQQALFESLLKARYPTRFTLFQTGNHGTPIRMIDWRRVLNWIFAG
ncbi:alpha/beta hydrolase [Rhizobium lentis]|uniref:Alpha/beta hydrolase n=1 Tax=Rhizobium lentis TaxID=1138194 RepID=A0ABS7II84_9HYPH|nr:alpha/beta hydrolase [Rhizobium lentis]MBX4972124.1 alpha/beta hydrolase [Rhizobium lentis]MBX4996655.1 alpha/beta hydrolase [Rhizobium lentis]MBX5016423.1 alpha/beta hydrolase [Rhizobium lentis]MBX5027542.1 alpha/beta hydrolase [Rhizobium lentis]MBX5043151.1 alpha/beta hydrolase [Rhizobium lentis]